MLWYIILAAVLVGGVYLGLLYPGKVQPDAMEKLRGRAYAHRGLHSLRNGVPENSLEAFDVAARHGYGIELDVRLSSDGEAVVFHDDSLARLCRVERRVCELTAEQLKKLRISGTSQFIPTLREALDTVGGRVPLMIELKTGRDGRRLCERVRELLADYPGDYCVVSFDPKALSWFKRHAPGVVRGQLATKMRGNAGNPVSRYMLENLYFNFLGRPQIVSYEHEFFSNANLKRCVTAFGAVACAWTVTDQNTFDNLTKIAPMIVFERFFPRTKYDNTVVMVRGRAVRPD
ncbi:MAG: glycerophosphodiester phosphodiesterase family protein [Eubacteriales bacterium]